ncbi:type IIL restriction-modification enzyme MmeI, partial [Escherichia coli]|uniref:type IIL restriction-modification enzyme MmeI n=1 Tax=Escherichia coli TaxID=562 RepID=UPI0028DD733A
MARLIFCFFAEDTDIFNGKRMFTATVEQFTERDGSNTHEVIGAIFTAMNTPTQHNRQPDDRYRKAAGLRPRADAFPYVNGGLF